MSKLYSGLAKGAANLGVLDMPYIVSYNIKESGSEKSRRVSVEFNYPEQASNFATALRSGPVMRVGFEGQSYTVEYSSIKIDSNGRKVVY